MNLENKNIWYFKEPRSGSTWLLRVLPKLLNREAFHLDPHLSKVSYTSPDQKIIKDQDYIINNENLFFDKHYFYSTHYFYLLEAIKNFHDLSLIRITRRNKIEQCLSLLYVNSYKTSMSHYYTDQTLNPNYKFFIKSLENPIIIGKKSVQETIKKIKNYQWYWEQYSKNHESYTFYYEDLYSEIITPFNDLPISFDDDRSMQKLPEYKKLAFFNYDQIIEWSKSYIDQYGIASEDL